MARHPKREKLEPEKSEELKLRIKWFVTLINNIRAEETRRLGLDKPINNKDFAKLFGVSGQTIAQWQDIEKSPDPLSIDAKLFIRIMKVSKMDANAFLEEMDFYCSDREDAPLKKSDIAVRNLRFARSQLRNLLPSQVIDQARLFMDAFWEQMQAEPLVQFRRSLLNAFSEAEDDHGMLKFDGITRDRIFEIIEHARPSLAEVRSIYENFNFLGHPLKDKKGNVYTPSNLVELIGYDSEQAQSNLPKSVKEAMKQFSNIQ